ncbi:CsbD family protein [Streptomyces cavernicola]|uniref:CsbD family protein n=1 Tax=Streptomyces cavernicola TaxID=3043613 RepID=A0ABT6SGA3_9ACTN|nr:CsbD family protein [Streptomyces sp. B-S-A6]MDI3406929.1 CsbD family protein [Streptomyces sp. B-S-A6]
MADKGGMDKAKGKAKEMTGKVTGDRKQQAEGKMQQARGEAKKLRGKAEEQARKAGRSTPDNPVDPM